MAQGYKILDNGAAEGVETHPDDLINLALEVRADEIVVPDVIGNAAETMRLAINFERYHQPGVFKHMAVVQGETPAELYTCVDQLMSLEYIDVLGIPRHLTQRFHKVSRVHVAAYISENYPRVPYHFLGYGSFMDEIKFLVHTNGRGIDTSMPIFMGMRHQAIEDHQFVPNRPESYFEYTTTEGQRQYIRHNVETFLEWAQASRGKV